jgi:integrase
MPVVQKQHQPTFAAETMSSIVRKAEGQEQVLYALLAGTGLRVGEAFVLEIRHLSADCRTITVEQSCWEGDIQTPKTRNAYRKVALCASLADLLKGRYIRVLATRLAIASTGAMLIVGHKAPFRLSGLS